MSAVFVPPDHLTDEEVRAFRRDGFLICRDLVPQSLVNRMLAVVERDSRTRHGDVEYEADVQYPGAPASREAEGGRTIRRLRQAFSRDPVFASLLREPALLRRLQQLLGDHIVMPLAHHNCLMTKHPRYSSETGWHQDTRYWSYQRPDLVNAWIALTPESSGNGCLQLLRGTHMAAVDAGRLDEHLFLRTELPENQSWLDAMVTAELSPGDVLFFHARCFHAASRNFSDHTKCSAVFTFRSLDNPPLPGTRSASQPELLLS